MKPISKQLIQKQKAILAQNEKINKQFCKRVEYVAKTICRIYKMPFGDCYSPFGDNFDYPLTDFESLIGDSEFINCELEFDLKNPYPRPKTLGCIFNQEECFLDYEFPSKWMTCAFEQELIDGKLEYENRHAKEIAAKKLKELKNSKVINSLKTKLTKTELKYLASKRAI